MSDQKRLKSTLAKLGQGPRDRRFSARDEISVLTSILTEVSETILTRRLTFSGDGGATLWIDVSNRRIITVEGLDADNFAELDDDGRDNLRAKLVAALPTNGRFSVQTAPVPDGVSLDLVGVSVQSLADAWGCDLYDADPVSANLSPGSIIASLNDIAIGSVDVPGAEIGAYKGEDRWRDPLNTIVAEALDDLRDRVLAGAKGGVRVMALRGANAMLLVAVDGKDAHLSVLPADALAALDDLMG